MTRFRTAKALIAVFGFLAVAAPACEDDGVHFDTLPPGAALPGGSDCATLVGDVDEQRTRNEPFNQTVGTDPHNQRPRVDGDFTGSTDEILQWASCKWGIDEDVVRSQAIRESYWFQQAAGDKTADQSKCHPLLRTTDGSQCPESVGILQVRWQYHTAAFEDSNAVWSTAYNADYAYASWRSCMDGEYMWLNNFDPPEPYPDPDGGDDQMWGCVGVWFSGRWHDAPAEQYITNVKAELADKKWDDASFKDATCSSCHNLTPTTPPPPTTTTSLSATTSTSSTTSTTSTTTSTTQPPTQGVWTETFDAPDSIGRFDWFIHDGANFFDDHRPWNGDHDDMCQGPTTVRSVDYHDPQNTQLFHDLGGDRAELVWWCSPGTADNGHLMTSFQTAGYGQVDFSPKQTFTDVTRICWDINGTNLGGRKWNQVVIVPNAVFEANKGQFDHRLDYVIPRLQDGPGQAGLRLDGGVYAFETVQGSAVVHVGQGHTVSNFTTIHKANADKATRLTNCLIKQGTSTRVEQERLDGTVMVRTLAGAFPPGPVRVIWQDDNYNPNKSCTESSGCPTVSNPLTWHWDSLRIESA